VRALVSCLVYVCAVCVLCGGCCVFVLSCVVCLGAAVGPGPGDGAALPARGALRGRHGHTPRLEGTYLVPYLARTQPLSSSLSEVPTVTHRDVKVSVHQSPHGTG